MKKAFILLLMTFASFQAVAEQTLMRCSQNQGDKIQEVRVDLALHKIEFFIRSTDARLPDLAQLSGTMESELRNEIDFLTLKIPFGSCIATEMGFFECKDFYTQLEFSSVLGGTTSQIVSMSADFILPPHHSKSPRVAIQLHDFSSEPLRFEFQSEDCSSDDFLQAFFIEALRSLNL